MNKQNVEYSITAIDKKCQFQFSSRKKSVQLKRYHPSTTHLEQKSQIPPQSNSRTTQTTHTNVGRARGVHPCSGSDVHQTLTVVWLNKKPNRPHSSAWHRTDRRGSGSNERVCQEAVGGDPSSSVQLLHSRFRPDGSLSRVVTSPVTMVRTEKVGTEFCDGPLIGRNWNAAERGTSTMGGRDCTLDPAMNLGGLLETVLIASGDNGCVHERNNIGG